jgi:hypothetical protein
VKRLQNLIKDECTKLGLEVPNITFIENDGEFIHFNIEAWDTFKYSRRGTDGRYIREGTDLNGIGISENCLIDKVVINQTRRKSYLEAYNTALKAANGNHKRVVALGTREYPNFIVVDDTVANASGDTHYFRFTTDETPNPNLSSWIGWDAADAYRNAKPYLKGNVTGISVITKADWELEYQAKVKG